MSDPVTQPKGIEPTPADVGRSVVYRGAAGEVETGVISSFNADYVWVRYGGSPNSQATLRGDLDSSD